MVTLLPHNNSHHNHDNMTPKTSNESSVVTSARTRMDQEAFQRAANLGICLKCICIFIDGKNVSIILKSDEDVQDYVGKHVSLGNYKGNFSGVCPCCIGFLQTNQLTVISDNIRNKYCLEADGRTVGWSVFYPPVLDVIRIASRTLVIQSAFKSTPFPTFEELYEKLLTVESKGTLNIMSLEEAEFKIGVDFGFNDEMGLCMLLDPSFKPCRKRKLHGGVDLRRNDHAFDISRKDADNLVATIRHAADSMRGYAELFSRVQTYFRSPYDSHRINVSMSEGQSSSMAVPMVNYAIRMYRQPIYLLGRYCKYARDISQAPWTLGSGCDDADTIDAGTAGEDKVEAEEDGAEEEASVAPWKPSTLGSASLPNRTRKGRSSVEEVICEAVTNCLKCKLCRLHPCGREDIDVRMLGNGRPFVLEVLEAEVAPDPEALERVLQFIESGAGGMNTDRDVKCRCLVKVSKSVWTTMQAAAEEKNKAYICVCWSAEKLDREKLRQLETLPIECGDKDAEGNPCLKIVQKTPLRVLHRRPLLPRPRFIYSLDTVPLNDHYFLLSVVTSAGTYVKEFVHGDLGRTRPSVSSILKINADILQLDVVWLFDSFEGNDSDKVDLTEDRNVRESSFDGRVYTRESWNTLKAKQLAMIAKKREAGSSI